MSLSTVFRKKLSSNETGATGAHVAGLLVPKPQLGFFPQLGRDVKNPRVNLLARDPAGRTWRMRFIYYNSRLFGGTRNEFRLTGLTGFFAQNGLRAGDIVILEKKGAELLIRAQRGESSSFKFPNPVRMVKRAAQKSRKVTRPVARFARVLESHGFIKTVPGEIRSNSYIFERDFRDGRTNGEFYFDLAVYGWNNNFYVELDDPSHELPSRKLRDRWKTAAARRVGVRVLRRTYDEIDAMTDDEIWATIRAYL